MVTPEATVFLGDSLTAEGNWAALFPAVPQVLNFGISGDTTDDVLARLGEVIDGKPGLVLLLIGTNDLLRGQPVDATADRIAEIVSRLRGGSPATRLILQTLPPVNTTLDPGLRGFAPAASALNDRLATLASSGGLQLVDVARALANDLGELPAPLSYDGLHLLPAGYTVWAERLRRDVPALAR